MEQIKCISLMRKINYLISSSQHQKAHVTAKRQLGKTHLSELDSVIL